MLSDYTQCSVIRENNLIGRLLGRRQVRVPLKDKVPTPVLIVHSVLPVN